MRLHCAILTVAAAALFAPLPGVAQVVIKLGTVAPEGSIWHDTLLEIREQWRSISNGEVELRIYAGGTLGGEEELVRKMQRRGLDAAALSGSGLPLIDSVIGCLNLPLAFTSYEQLDFVRGRISAELEQSFEESGYKILSWAEAGWVHFFARSPIRTPTDLRELRLWIGAGDPNAERLAKELGFRVVPLPATEMLTSLQTGLVEAIDVPPLFAMLDRSFQAAPYMTDLRYAPLIAATVITLPAWQRIPAVHRERLLAAAQNAAADMRADLDRAERGAIDEMLARGLNVVSVDAAAMAEWRRESQAVYPRLECNLEHPELYAKVMQLLEASNAAR
jgi:TRAP-type C4-dicarboxylate transport system substrate-binding protein